MHRSLGYSLLGVCALLTPLFALAHHSVAFYSNDKTELAGKITNVDWRNPHIQFGLQTVGADGKEVAWKLESSAIFLREKDGVTRDLFQVGDEVKVFGRLSSHDSTAMLVTNMLLPDGREAPLWPNSTAHFVGPDKWITAHAELADAAAENRGIFRVWRPNETSLAALPYTDAAIAARRSFDLLAAAARCEPEGMPRIMLTLFPYEFVDRGTDILVRAQIYDTERVIHMDRTAPPPGEPRSKLGYSVGEWRDGALVIQTRLANWPYFDQIGTPIGPDATFTERYKLSADQRRLDLELTVVDAATFKAPAVVKTSWLAYGDTIERYDCRAR